ncbi:MAG: hypothetical protein GEU79_08640, partial [Acidimicrobiia bacterium]|nr:hypothetical protein [Acidimicrobiia bacterium]
MHANYFHGFDLAPITDDLELNRYGFEIVVPEIQHACLYRDGRALVIHRDVEKTCESIARFSTRDAATYRELFQRYGIDKRKFFAAQAFNPPVGPEATKQRLEENGLSELAEFARDTPYNVIDRHFESEAMRVFYKKLLHIVHANNFSGTGGWFPLLVSNAPAAALPIGGAVNFPKALAAVVKDNSGMVKTGAHVNRVIVENGVAQGVELADGSTITADFVVSGVDFPQTVALAGFGNFEDDVAASARNWRWT